MWFECVFCGNILPIYEVSVQSARFSPEGEWICSECEWDLNHEFDEIPEDYLESLCAPSLRDPEDDQWGEDKESWWVP